MPGRLEVYLCHALHFLNVLWEIEKSYRRGGRANRQGLELLVVSHNIANRIKRESVMTS